MIRRMMVTMAALLCVGCTTVEMRRSALTATCDFVLPDNPKGCDDAAVERTPKFSIAYVEFTDQGWFYNRGQLERVLTVLNEESSQKKLQVVLFIHGWKHSAKTDDRDVQHFRAVIMPRFAKLDSEARTIGIYVGWRGAALELPDLIQNLTFYDRKATAEHVARGSVRELLSQLRTIKTRHIEAKRQMDVTAIGHSFGGLILFNAMAGTLLDSLVVANNGSPGKPRLVTPIFDRVVLLNPAFEASRFEPLFQAAKDKLTDAKAPWAYSSQQQPIFISITSEADLATKIAFPLGRKVNSFFEHEGLTDQDDENIEYSNRLEKLANTHTIGHMARYRTHELALSRNSNAAVPLPPDRTPIECKAFRNLLLPEKTRFPLWNLFAKKEVIDGHSAIYWENLWDFIASISKPGESEVCR